LELFTLLEQLKFLPFAQEWSNTKDFLLYPVLWITQNSWHSPRRYNNFFDEGGGSFFGVNAGDLT
jgi:hypothetical protein